MKAHRTRPANEKPNISNHVLAHIAKLKLNRQHNYKTCVISL